MLPILDVRLLVDVSMFVTGCGLSCCSSLSLGIPQVYGLHLRVLYLNQVTALTTVDLYIYIYTYYAKDK